MKDIKPQCIDFDTIDRLPEGIIEYFSPVASQYVFLSKDSEDITTGPSLPKAFNTEWHEKSQLLTNIWLLSRKRYKLGTYTVCCET